MQYIILSYVNKPVNSFFAQNKEIKRLSKESLFIFTNYFTSTAAPTSVNLALIDSASSFEAPSLSGLGALSTNSLASFNPKPVISLTAFITLIFSCPTAFNTTSNSDFSSSASPPAAAGAAATATAAGAAALTPNSSSNAFTKSDKSNTV